MENPNEYPRRSSPWPWVILIIIIIVVAAVGIYFYFYYQNQQQALGNVLNQYQNQLQNAQQQQQQAQQQQNQQNNQQPTTTAKTVQVSIKNFAYSPASITINKGDTVVWTNQDSAAHTVTGDNGGPNSGNLQTGATYSFKFDTAGTFAYHCAIHPMMKGTVVVQ